MSYLIGVDGGGTKTIGVLCNTQGTVLATGMVGATNPNDVTLPVTVERLTQLCRQLMTTVGLREESLPDISFFFGIAGGINHGPALEAALQGDFPTAQALRVRSDIQILLAGELPEEDGACIICGTGSACFLRKQDRLVRIGGWGYLLDSGGSGYDMGRDAMEAALRQFDGRGEQTCLSELLAEFLGGPVQDRITEVYSLGKPYVASCAPLVFEAARKGDAVAQAILTRNARKLAEYAECAWRWLIRDVAAPPPRLPVVMGGSISVKQAPMWQSLIRELTDPAIPAEFFPATLPPVFGAVVEAKRQSREGDAFSVVSLREAFSQSYKD